MVCPDLQLLEDYIARRLPEAESQVTREHLERCGACAVLVREFGENEDLIDELGKLERGPRQDPTMPQEVGPYQIRRILGEGGMGVVYEATQPNLARRVALKVMRGDMTDARRVRSFEREVQTLARLKHPSIAVIYEAGTASAGERYFAMELVEGAPLDQYLAAADPDLEERLGMFCEICDAIHYAHGMGVVHRDLKPANIMVDASGAPKVLDFGLARLMDPNDRLASTLDSSASRIQGTLPYMSPEQARGPGVEVGPASDTYSLGVLLHEMLTGTRPFDMRNVPPLRAVQMICEETPRPPSFFRPGIPLDLDIIAQKCVRKEASSRYTSVDELRKDVVRHLNGQPILARPLSIAYKVRRFVGRHRALTATSFLLFATLVGGVIWQGIQSSRSRAEAERATRRSEFLQGVLVSLNPQTRGRVLTTPEALEAALGAIDEKFERDPEGEAEVRLSIGRTLGGLGSEELALDQGQKALALYRSLGPGFVEERLDCMGVVANSLRLNGDYQGAERLLFEERELWSSMGPRQTEGQAGVESALADLRTAQGRHREAVEHATRSLEAYRSLPGDQQTSIAHSLTLVGEAHIALEEFAEGMEALQEAFEILRAKYGMRHARTAIAWGNVGGAHRRSGNTARAEEILRENLPLLRELLGSDHLETAMATGNLGLALARLDRTAEAEPFLRESLEWFESASPSQILRGLTFQAQLALILAQRGGFAESREILERIVQQRRKALDDRSLPQSLNHLGQALIEAGRIGDAESAFQESLDLYRKLGLADEEVALTCRNNLVTTLALRGAAARAEPLFRQVVAEAEESWGENHVSVGAFRINVAYCLRDQWKNAEAEAEGRRALEILRRGTRSPHTFHVRALNNIAAVLLQTEDYDGALECIEEAFKLSDELLDETNPLFLKVRHLQALYWLATGDVTLAEEEARELLRLREANDQDLDLADALVLRGRVFAEREKFEDAEVHLARGANLRRATLIEGHWRVASVDSLRGECLASLDRFDAAEALLLPSSSALIEALGPSNRLSREAQRRLLRLYEATERTDEAEQLRARLDGLDER